MQRVPCFSSASCCRRKMRSACRWYRVLPDGRPKGYMPLGSVLPSRVPWPRWKSECGLGYIEGGRGHGRKQAGAVPGRQPAATPRPCLPTPAGARYPAIPRAPQGHTGPGLRRSGWDQRLPAWPRFTFISSVAGKAVALPIISGGMGDMRSSSLPPWAPGVRHDRRCECPWGGLRSSGPP